MKFKLLCIGAALSFLYMFSAETKENYSGLSATVPNANSSDSDNQKLQNPLINTSPAVLPSRLNYLQYPQNQEEAIQTTSDTLELSESEETLSPNSPKTEEENTRYHKVAQNSPYSSEYEQAIYEGPFKGILNSSDSRELQSTNNNQSDSVNIQLAEALKNVEVLENELEEAIADKEDALMRLDIKRMELEELDSKLKYVNEVLREYDDYLAEKEAEFNRLAGELKNKKNADKSTQTEQVNTAESVVQTDSVLSKTNNNYKKYQYYADPSSIPDNLFANERALHLNGEQFGKHLKTLLKAKKVSNAGIRDLYGDLYNVDMKKSVSTKNIDMLTNSIGKMLYANPSKRSVNVYLQLLKAIIFALGNNNKQNAGLLPIAQALGREMLLADKVL